jgi:hypothetical protein
LRIMILSQEFRISRMVALLIACKKSNKDKFFSKLSHPFLEKYQKFLEFKFHSP